MTASVASTLPAMPITGNRIDSIDSNRNQQSKDLIDNVAIIETIVGSTNNKHQLTSSALSHPTINSINNCNATGNTMINLRLQNGVSSASNSAGRQCSGNQFTQRFQRLII